MEERKETVVYPGDKIGILGGGQLGRMMALEARRMGYRVATLDPTPDSPCGQVSDEQVLASFGDVEAAKHLAQSCDVVTYEFENVDADVAAILEQFSFVPQGSALLRTTQNRHREKQAISSCGVRVAPYVPVQNHQDLMHAVEEVGFPCILKTTEGGYDGKGQWLLRTVMDANDAWNEYAAVQPAGFTAAGAPGAPVGGYPLIVEQYIPFEKELSVVVARNAAGEVVSFPVSENIHQAHILHLSIVPARASEDVQQQAVSIAERIARKLQVVGLLAVEMFLTKEGDIYVNELAPRPHNSGHFTMDACLTSQFEQQVRAVCGLPLGTPKLLSAVVMVNILGEHMDAVMHLLPNFPANMKLHLYGKKDAKVKRKMGHINVLADTVDDALKQIQALGIWSGENE